MTSSLSIDIALQCALDSGAELKSVSVEGMTDFDYFIQYDEEPERFSEEDLKPVDPTIESIKNPAKTAKPDKS